MLRLVPFRDLHFGLFKPKLSLKRNQVLGLESTRGGRPCRVPPRASFFLFLSCWHAVSTDPHGPTGSSPATPWSLLHSALVQVLPRAALGTKNPTLARWQVGTPQSTEPAHIWPCP